MRRENCPIPLNILGNSVMPFGHLRRSVRYLKGVGERRAEALEKCGVQTVHDLLTFFPRRYLDRSRIAKISELELGREVTAIGSVVAFRTYGGRKARFVLILRDESGELRCTWFHGAHYLRNAFRVGEWLAVHGKVRFFNGYQISHPEFDRLTDPDSETHLHTGKIIPLYPGFSELESVGLDSRGLRRILFSALSEISPEIKEILPERILGRYRLLGRRAAFNMVHFPDSEEQLQAAIRRLKYEELFFLELMMALRMAEMRKELGGIQFKLVGDKTKSLMSRVPFELTESQKKVLREIWSDMQAPHPMNRLLQGDVGAGKTIVALTAMLIAVENGYQTGLMAPTEILAEQHYLTVRQWLDELGVSAALLVGGQRKSERDEILQKLISGEVQMVIGTHALFQEQIQFKRLGLVVIDEQHRFGVVQRAMLRKKALNPDVLVMTATPIPRTLALTVYGDLDVSTIDQKPGDRQPIKTVWRYDGKKDEIYRFVRSEAEKGRQAYIVFPLVEDSEKIDLQAATENYEKLKSGIFEGLRIALLHGRMSGQKKDEVMTAFKNGECRILISTTVIEVGVDVPNASIMVVEHAERFGLTQLHQLRGRVGRGSEQSHCILIAYRPLGGVARTRLQTLAKTTDGFEIAEVDLKIRGPGEFFGVRQSGIPKLRIANILEDYPILQAARKEAFELVKNDPALSLSENIIVKAFFAEFYQDRFRLSKVA
ncbi:MAG: ATP-dependent DNA helicase RecG [bacterium]